MEGLHRKNGAMNFSESSEEEDQSVNRAAYIEPESEVNTEIMRFGFEILLSYFSSNVTLNS